VPISRILIANSRIRDIAGKYPTVPTPFVGIMVHTRSRTLKRVPTSKTLWPDAVVRPRTIPRRRLPLSRPTRPSPPSGLQRMLTTRDGAQPNRPVLNVLFEYLNGADLENLSRAFPTIRRGLKHDRAPVPSFRCQDQPANPAIKVRQPHNGILLLTVENPASAPQCDIPGHLNISQQRCEGRRLGLCPTLNLTDQNGGLVRSVFAHSDNFWVCVHCARRNWERYSLEANQACYDLCLPCSQNYRANNPILAIDQCVCQWDHRDADLHLCRICRACQSFQGHATDFQRLNGYNSNMDGAFHPTALQPPRRVTDFVHPMDTRGESSCICGRSVQEKIDTYRVANPPPGGIWFSQHDFRQLIRICTHCNKSNFMTQFYPW
jgi:hypothetical protein